VSLSADHLGELVAEQQSLIDSGICAVSAGVHRV
jgi:hypothetical protein